MSRNSSELDRTFGRIPAHHSYSSLDIINNSAMPLADFSNTKAHSGLHQQDTLTYHKACIGADGRLCSKVIESRDGTHCQSTQARNRINRRSNKHDETRAQLAPYSVAIRFSHTPESTPLATIDEQCSFSPVDLGCSLPCTVRPCSVPKIDNEPHKAWDKRSSTSPVERQLPASQGVQRPMTGTTGSIDADATQQSIRGMDRAHLSTKGSGEMGYQPLERSTGGDMAERGGRESLRGLLRGVLQSLCVARRPKDWLLRARIASVVSLVDPKVAAASLSAAPLKLDIEFEHVRVSRRRGEAVPLLVQLPLSHASEHPAMAGRSGPSISETPAQALLPHAFAERRGSADCQRTVYYHPSSRAEEHTMVNSEMHACLSSKCLPSNHGRLPQCNDRVLSRKSNEHDDLDHINTPLLYEREDARAASVASSLSTSYSGSVLGVDLDLLQQQACSTSQSSTTTALHSPQDGTPPIAKSHASSSALCNTLPASTKAVSGVQARYTCTKFSHHRYITSVAIPSLLPIAVASGIVKLNDETIHASYYSPSGSLIQPEETIHLSSPLLDAYHDKDAASDSIRSRRSPLQPLTTPPNHKASFSSNFNQLQGHHRQYSHAVPQLATDIDDVNGRERIRKGDDDHVRKKSRELKSTIHVPTFNSKYCQWMSSRFRAVASQTQDRIEGKNRQRPQPACAGKSWAALPSHKVSTTGHQLR